MTYFLLTLHVLVVAYTLICAILTAELKPRSEALPIIKAEIKRGTCVGQANPLLTASTWEPSTASPTSDGAKSRANAAFKGWGRKHELSLHTEEPEPSSSKYQQPP